MLDPMAAVGYNEIISLFPQLQVYHLRPQHYLVCLLEPLLVFQWESSLD